MKRKISAARRAQLIEQLKKARAARGGKNAKKARKYSNDAERIKTEVYLKARKVRVKSKKKPRKIGARAKNPIRHTPLYIIVAQKGNGPKMHYNGVKFTNNGKPVFFENAAQLKDRARELVKKFPILRDYKLTGVPIRGTVSGK